jgi:hypothetical protein
MKYSNDHVSVAVVVAAAVVVFAAAVLVVAAAVLVVVVVVVVVVFNVLACWLRFVYDFVCFVSFFLLQIYFFTPRFTGI